ncbi:MAG TPA: VWA domain-containing protein [Thermoanaerobaculia bacterium]|nr:VWA domain-containing protein [Thermoanaerobaculia bacterium]
MLFVSPVMAGLAGLLLVPVLVGAQPPAAETFSGRVDVTAAEVEVFVADRDGKPVPDLLREDFKVLEDGQPAEVTAVSRGDAQPLNLAVFFDQTTLDATSQRAALDGLRRFFAALKPGNRVLLASWDGSLEVRAEPTGDAAVLRAALDRLGEALPTGLKAAQERNTVAQEIRDALPFDDERTGALARSQAKAALDNLREYARARGDEARATFGALQQTLVLLSGLPDRKALLYVGGGPPLKPGLDLFNTWQGRYAALAPSFGYSPLETSRYEAGRQAQDVVDRANGAGIPLFALALPRGGERSDAEDSGRALRTLAAGTGGRVVADVDNPALFLEAVGRDLASSYLLIYAPPAGRKPGPVHRIEVTAREGTLTVRHREARRDGDTGDPLLRQALAAMWAGSGGETNPLHAELAFEETGKDDAGRLLVSGLLTVPLAPLAVQPQEHFHTGHLTLALAARDGKGKISGLPKAEIPIEIPNEHLLSAPGQTAGYKFVLHLAPGESVVAVAVRDDMGGGQSVIRTVVGPAPKNAGTGPPPVTAVPPPPPQSPTSLAIQTLPSPGVGIESAALLMSGQQGGDLGVGALALPIPGESDKARLLVRVRIDGKGLLAGQTGNLLRIEGDLYALGAGDGSPGEGIAASAVERIEIALASQRAAVERDGVDFLAGLDLKPGVYSLRLLVRNLDTGKLAVRNLPFTVPDLASLKNAPLPAPPPPAGSDPRPTARAADLGPLDPPPFPDDPVAPAAPALAAAPPPPPPPVPETAEGRRLRSLARASYREILKRLAAGREGEAVAAVAAFEDSLLLRASRPMTVEQLVETEAGFLKELAAANPQSLVPVLRLHQRLYQDATTRRRLQGSTVARDVFLKGVDLLRPGSGGALLTRQFLATFGAELMRSGTRYVGELTLRRVLAEDPADEVVLFELAADAERRGNHAAAALPLETLLQAHPDNREALLRRAIGLARMGKKDEAETQLTAFLSGETEPWRLSLVYQELSRLRLADHPKQAEATLREGLQRLPGDEKLTLLLAELQEKSWQASAARQTIAAIKPETTTSGGAARHRYSTPPQEPLANAIAALDRESAARLPALAAALEKTAP